MNRKFNALFIAVAVVLFAALQGSSTVNAQAGSGVYGSGNPFYSGIPRGATYTADPRIGTFRQGMQEWASPVYRVEAGVSVPLVTITNTYSGRVEQWPIPTYAVPAVAEDGHLAVMHYGTNTVYELFAAVWLTPTTMQAGGMVAYSMAGNGVTDRPNRRVTASGVANTNGMVIAEDFQNGANSRINHALSLHIPRWMIDPNGFVAPAVGAEAAGTDVSGNGVPMGARFALPSNLNVDSLNVHPFTRELLRAARDYGLFVTDGTGTPSTASGQAIGTIEVEPGLIGQLYGVSGNDLISTVEDEVAAVIASYGIFRVTVNGSAPQPPAEVPTQAPVVPTVAPVIPTVAPVVPTNVPVRPTDVIAPPAEVPTEVPPVVVPPVVPTNVPPVVPPVVEQPPVQAPGMSTAGSYAATASTTVAVGTRFNVDLILVNPVSVYGFVADCTGAPEEIVNGEDINMGSLFSDHAEVRDENFEYADYFYFTIHQRTPVNATGTVATISLQAVAAGTVTMTCENYAIDENGEWVYVPFTALTITVQ